MKVLSLNVHGLRKRSKRLSAFRLFKKLGCDIVALQESYVTDELIEQWTREWGGRIHATPGTNHSKGNVLLLSKHFVGEHVEFTEQNDRIQTLSFKLDGENYQIVNCYGPCEQNLKKAFLHELERYVEGINVDGTNVIMLGDFNLTLNKNLDVIAGHAHDAGFTKVFNEVINKLKCTDIWRQQHEIGPVA